MKLCLTAQASDGDVLLIELNGTADPLPLLEAFTLREERLRFLPRWQIGVLDARHWGSREEFTPLERRQLETATHWLTTHTEDLSEFEQSEVAGAPTEMNPYGTWVKASELALILSNAIGRKMGAGRVFSVRTPASVRDHEHTLSHRFTGCQFPLPGRYRQEQIMRLLQALPREVVRAKALVKLIRSPGCSKAGRIAVPSLPCPP